MHLIKNPTKRCAAIHDLSCYGHTSLLAAIPILNTLGVQVFPLPTALLSTHSQLKNFRFFDLTDQMRQIIEHWKELELHFDAIYSGFLGSHAQTEIVQSLIDWQKPHSPIIVVDPVLGDNGRTYDTIDKPLIQAMRELVASADVITPNFTELCVLLNEDYHQYHHREELCDDIRKLADLGPDIVIVTSVPDDQRENSTSVIGYSKGDGRFWKVPCNYLPGAFPGTGDAFASVITGALLQGDSLPIALDRAVAFATMGVRAVFGYQKAEAEGILLEKVLPSLYGPSQINSYEIFD